MRVRGNSPGIYEPVAQFDSAQNKYIPLPLDLGPESDSIYLSLFGTGWRGVNAPGDVKVKFRTEADILNPIEVPVQYVGKQPTIEGLDQINVLVPRSLLGKGLINIGVSIKKGDSVAYLTNQVQINVR